METTVSNAARQLGMKRFPHLMKPNPPIRKSFRKREAARARVRNMEALEITQNRGMTA